MQNKRTVVIRKNSGRWQPKIKRQEICQAASQPVKTRYNAGFVNPVAVIAVFAVIAGLFYLYVINQSAVKGFQIKQTEKEIAQIRKDNESLRIREAELKSLYHIEASSKNMDMSALKDVEYVDGSLTVALGEGR